MIELVEQHACTSGTNKEALPLEEKHRQHRSTRVGDSVPSRHPPTISRTAHSQHHLHSPNSLSVRLGTPRRTLVGSLPKLQLLLHSSTRTDRRRRQSKPSVLVLIRRIRRHGDGVNLGSKERDGLVDEAVSVQASLSIELFGHDDDLQLGAIAGAVRDVLDFDVVRFEFS